MKYTKYFEATRERQDRAQIELEWIEQVVTDFDSEIVQTDGRIRRLAKIAEMDNRYLRVVLLEDQSAVVAHNKKLKTDKNKSGFYSLAGCKAPQYLEKINE